MNGKSLGERGQHIAIGELAKYGIVTAIPLSDNLPFDLILIIGNNLWRTQVKSSSAGDENFVAFVFSNDDWYTGEKGAYTKENVDVIIGVALRTNAVYIFDDFENIKSITIRIGDAKNNQRKGIHLHDDFVISEERLNNVFGYETPKMDNYWASFNYSKNHARKKHEHICELCGKKFQNSRKNAKYCGGVCYRKASRKVPRPEMEILRQDMASMSWRAMSRKYGVTDNAIKKWARFYGLLEKRNPENEPGIMVC